MFMCLLAICVPSLEKCLFQSFACFKIVIFCYWVVRVFYITSYSDIWFVNIFSHSVDWLMVHIFHKSLSCFRTEGKSNYCFYVLARGKISSNIRWKVPSMTECQAVFCTSGACQQTRSNISSLGESSGSQKIRNKCERSMNYTYCGVGLRRLPERIPQSGVEQQKFTFS